MDAEIVVRRNLNSQLAKLERAKEALATCTTVEHAKEIEDVGKAFQAFAKIARLGWWYGFQGAKLRVRAMRCQGEMLDGMELQGGDRKSKYHHGILILKDLDISLNQSHRAQLVAKIPEPEFDAHIDAEEEKHGELTLADLYQLARGFVTEKTRSRMAKEGEGLENPGVKHKDFRNVIADGDVDEGTVDLIFTDPPYDKESLVLWPKCRRRCSCVTSQSVRQALRPGLRGRHGHSPRKYD